MRRVLAAAAACGVLVVAGCSGGSDGSDGSGGVTVTDAQTARPTTSGSTPPTGSATASPTAASPTATSSTPGASTPPPGASTPVPTASVAQPPDPVVAAGNAAAWSLTRAAPGAPETRQLATVTCGQDGSVTADGLRLTAGATGLTLTDPAVTVTGTADLDAAGGTFRGRNADTAVTFTWTC